MYHHHVCMYIFMYVFTCIQHDVCGQITFAIKKVFSSMLLITGRVDVRVQCILYMV